MFVEGLRDLPKLRSLSILWGACGSFDSELDLSGIERLLIRSEDTIEPQFLSRCSSLETVSLNGSGVADLTPLSEMTRLKELWLHKDTMAVELPKLTKLGALQRVLIHSDQMQDVSALSEVDSLLNVDLTGRRIRELGGEWRSRNLNFAVLRDNSISDLKALSSSDGLWYLDVSRTLVEDLRPLTSLPKLARLTLDESRVSSLEPLADCMALNELRFAGTDISDLTPLSNLPNLGLIDLSRTRVKDLKPLANLPLYSLLLAGTDVASLEPLRAMQRLRSLDLRDTRKLHDLRPIKHNDFTYQDMREPFAQLYL